MSQNYQENRTKNVGAEVRIAGDSGQFSLHLRNWVNERTSANERQAREIIANAIESDRSYPQGSTNKVPRRIRGYRGAIVGVNHQTIGRLQRIQEALAKGYAHQAQKIAGKLSGTNVHLGLQTIEGRGGQIIGIETDYPNIDSVNGEPFITRIIREQNAWVAEEVRPNGDYISQVRLYDDDRPPDLTLLFTSDHYTQKNADISISIDTQQRYPTGANATFHYLAGSLGLVDWKGPGERLIGKVTSVLRGIEVKGKK